MLEQNHNTLMQKLLGVDTTKIILAQGNYSLLQNNSLRYRGKKFTRTATKEEKQLGLYRPKVVIENGDCSIEFSLPKLLRGNNVEEICVGDFPKILELLRSHLLDYGIETTTDNIAWADLYRMDAGKNCNLIKIGTVVQVLKILHRCLISGRKSDAQIQYRNGGRALRIHNKSADFIIYDKFRCPEMTDGSEKAICEIMGKSSVEVLRMEKRFNNRRSLCRLFRKYGVQRPKFQDILNPQIAQDVIGHGWQELMDGFICPEVYPQEEKLKQVLNHLNTSKSSLCSVLSCVAIQLFLKHYSANELKNRFRPWVSAPTINSLFKKVQAFANKTGVKPDILGYISDQINQWQPITLPLGDSDGKNI